MNVLGQSDKPLFFQVSNADALGFGAPDIRLGDALSTWVQSLHGMQKQALVHSARTGLTWRLASDEGDYLNGYDEAPCPLAFFTTGMVASYMNEITAHAQNKGVEIKHVRLIQDNYYTMEGSMPKRTMVGGALPIDLEVEIDCALSGDELRNFIFEAVAASPLNGLLRGQLASLFALSLNGSELAPEGVAPIPSGLVADPGPGIDQAEPVVPGEALIKNLGKAESRAGEKLTKGAGSSLTSDQSRMLHVRGICTLREDGMKEIEKHLYSPAGSVYRFLSEEAPVNGGKGRAPDANTYFSAGIGFCFMTQFGRYCSILKKQMSSYRILQHTHMALGGASGNTGKAGTADPVETHVFLESEEGQEFAQDILTMSERTCFLHALCRTDLKPKISIST